MLEDYKINIKFVFICLFLIFFSLSSVYAANSYEDSDFSTLTKEISDSNSSITLTKNYTQTPNENNVGISKSIEINGDGHSFSSNIHNPLFKINEDVNLTFKNITFNYEDKIMVDCKTSPFRFLIAHLIWMMLKYMEEIHL